MPQPLPYLSENALRHYPFKDGISLSGLPSFGGAVVLPNSAFLDAQFTITSGLAKRVSLTRLALIGKSGVNFTYEFQFAFYLPDGTALTSISFTSVCTTSRQVLTYQTTDKQYSIKLVIGDWFVNRPVLFQYTFNKENAEFSSDVILLPFASVTSITLKNTDENRNPITFGTYTDDTLVLKGGTNTFFDHTNNEAGLSVIAGRGEGLYDPCGALTGVIKTINGNSPNSIGNFGFFGDECFNIVPEVAAIQVVPTCSPKCSQDQVVAYADYVNRLKDALILIAGYCEDVRGSLFTQMEAYKQHLELLQLPQAPFIEESYVSTLGAKAYLSFAVGIYNPERNTSTDSVIAGNLSVTNNIAGFTYLIGTSTLKVDSNTIRLPGLGFIDQALSCRSTAVHEFVLQGSATSIHNANIEFRFIETGKEHPSGAYKMDIVFPDSFYITSKYKRVWRENKYIYQFSFDFLDASGSPTTRNTSCTIMLGSGLTYIPNTAILNRNNTDTIVQGIANVVSFSALPINSSQKATLTFNAESISGGSTCSVTAQNGASAFGRTFNVT